MLQFIQRFEGRFAHLIADKGVAAFLVALFAVLVTVALMQLSGD